MAVAGRPAHEATRRVEMAGDTLDESEIDRLRGRSWFGKTGFGRRRGAEMLEIAVADRARQHVQQLNMAGFAFDQIEFAAQRLRQRRQYQAR